MRAMPGILPPSKKPRRWLLMCLQKHKLTPDSNNRAGRAAKLLRSTVSTWLVTRCPAWLGLFPDFSLHSLFSHSNPRWCWPGEMWEKQNSTKQQHSQSGMAWLVHKQVLPAIKVCYHTQTEKVSLMAAEQRLKDWGTSNSHHNSLQQVLPAWTQLEASPQNTHLQMSHTGTDSVNFNFGLSIKESHPWFLP